MITEGVSPDIFGSMLVEAGKRSRETVPLEQAWVLLLDTGGNAVPHISVHMTRACERWNIVPCF